MSLPDISIENRYKVMRTFTDNQNTRSKQELTISYTVQSGFTPEASKTLIKSSVMLVVRKFK